MAEPIMAWLGKGRALNYRVLQRSGKAVNCKAVNYKALKRSGEAGKGDDLQWQSTVTPRKGNAKRLIALKGKATELHSNDSQGHGKGKSRKGIAQSGRPGKGMVRHSKGKAVNC